MRTPEALPGYQPARRYRYYSLTFPQHAMFMAVMAITVLLAVNVYWLSAVGAGAFVFFLTRLILETGEDITIENLILVIASLQWVLGPVMTYQGLSDHYKYYMYVGEQEYMALAVPGIILFAIGLYFFRSRRRAIFLHGMSGMARAIANTHPYIPYYLIGTGFLFSFVLPYMPTSFHFPAHVLSNLKYIGIIYILFSDRYRNKLAILFIAFMLSALSSLNNAMFHDLILWFAFIGMYYAFIKKPTVGRKLFIVFLIFIGLYMLQAAKQIYRESLEFYGKEDVVSQFGASVGQALEEEEGSGNVEKFVNRINQGWIISRIMSWVPNKVEHADGDTVIAAVKATLLPRLLYPDKPIAGGRENFQKYTGYQLTRSTSMGISLLGEAYINFGLWGGWLFMFLMGLLFSWAIKQLFLLTRRYPTFWLWLPLVLLHFVKAETELLVQLNYLFKSAILIVAFLFFNKHFLKLRI